MGPVFPYDAALLAAVQAVPQSIPEVLQIMQNIAAICADDDGLKWFNGLYLEVTAAVQARVAVAGGFADPAWLAELDVQFARLYFSAVRTSLSDEPTPQCWQALFNGRSRNAVARIRFALAGMNAHINYDLAEAIVNTCVDTVTTPDHAGAHYDDYTALNSTLDSLIEKEKQQLNVRLPGDALPPLTHLEDTIASWHLSAARESAWQTAEHLWQVRGSAFLTASLESLIDGFTSDREGPAGSRSLRRRTKT